MKKSIKAKLRRNRILAIIVGAILVFFCIMLVIQILDLRKKNEDLSQRSQRLDEQLEEQQQRQEELDEEESYADSTEYIEEKARTYGYVYPDEIVFKKED